jgi:hypothetical protein
VLFEAFLLSRLVDKSLGVIDLDLHLRVGDFDNDFPFDLLLAFALERLLGKETRLA